MIVLLDMFNLLGFSQRKTKNKHYFHTENEESNSKLTPNFYCWLHDAKLNELFLLN